MLLRFEFEVMKVIGQCMTAMPNRVNQILEDTRDIQDTNVAVSQAVNELKELLPWTDFGVFGFMGTVLKKALSLN